MIKKQAFTLTEIFICLIIIGVLAVVTFSHVRHKDFSSQVQIASLYKALEVVSEASVNILLNEQTCVPTSRFITKIINTQTFTFYKKSNPTQAADINDIFSLYQTYIKFEKTDGFCNYTKYCTSGITGGKIAGNIAIGIEKYSDLKDCPSVYIPETTTKTSKTELNVKSESMENEKCWGQIYIDVNGNDEPNKEGTDVFIYGLGATGVVK